MKGIFSFLTGTILVTVRTESIATFNDIFLGPTSSIRCGTVASSYFIDQVGYLPSKKERKNKHRKIGQTHSKIWSRHCAAAFPLQVPKSCTDLNLTMLYISILDTYSKFVRENKILALCVCLPQPCPSAGRRFAVSRPRLTEYWQFVSFNTTTNSMKCFVNWIPSNTHIRFEQNPTLP